MQVVNRLGAFNPLVDDQPVTPVETFPLRDYAGRVEYREMVAGVGDKGEAGDLGAGRDHNMHRRLGIYVAKRDHMLVLVDDVAGDFAPNDLGEERGHCPDAKLPHAKYHDEA